MTSENTQRFRDGLVSRRRFLGGTLAAAAGVGALAGGANQAVAATTSSGAGPLPGPVRIDNGLLSGTTAQLSGVSAYLGIPYAASTAGANRWRPPRPAAAWSGVRKADAFGDIPPQKSMGPGGSSSGPAQSEDCLNLNVWTGATSSHERRPVLVWIYGGRFALGSGADPTFDGAGLAAKGLVVVTLNYREGALGFLATPELTAEDEHNSSGNYGLLDQIAALQWVQRNIHAFGGNPDQVTIAGQSAGSASVLELVYSPLGRGLFHGAIAESGARYPRDPETAGLATSYRPTLSGAETQGSAYLQQLGVTTIAEARALDYTKVIAGENANDTTVSAPMNGNPPLFRPVLDGYVQPRSYQEALSLGRHNDVPIITGNNKDESGATPTANTTLAAYQAMAKTKYGSLESQFLALYPASTDTEAWEQTNASARDSSRISTSLWATEWLSKAKSPVFTYFWTHAPPGQDRGAFHGSEIQYVFDNLYSSGSGWTDTDQEIADTLSDYVVNFVTHGDPNGKGLTHWAPARRDAYTTMELGDSWGPVADAPRDQLDFYVREYFPGGTAW
ncbi:carboxylesterase family protein [Streptomyces sp. NPDC005423]|uniref:carboxylesterase/lipase family protein n=1 Tax=Streptomyces sp. NPDC005423 TaxID=3155343 RepID=UPI0033A00CB6